MHSDVEPVGQERRGHYERHEIREKNSSADCADDSDGFGKKLLQNHLSKNLRNRRMKPLQLYGFVCFANFVVKSECILMWNLWGGKEGVTTKGTKYAKQSHPQITQMIQMDLERNYFRTI